MKRAVLGLALLSGLTGCGDDDCCAVVIDARVDTGSRQDANPGLIEVALVPNTTNRDLDLLFIVDDSPSMLDKQINLRASFSSFIGVLGSGGLPNVHIGVVSTDMGSKGADDTNAGPGIGSGPGSCSGLGKDGVLQTYGSANINGNFLSDINGVRNYTGTLVERFNEIAAAGSSGCGFEQPFHAMRRALDNNPSNAGFLRPTARLGIILLSDEDDCSMSHSTLMGNDTTTLGPLQSFRCYRFGVTCDVGGATPDQMNMVGTKDACHSNEGSAYLADIGRYVTFLNGLKADPREIVFGAIVGPTAPFQVELRTPPGGGTAIPAVAHSCTYAGANGAEVADPAVRIGQLVTSLERGSAATICNGNLGSAMSDLANRMKPLVGDTCLQQSISQPAVCEAFDIDGLGNTSLVPACASNGNSPPCFSIEADAALCPAHQNLKVVINRTAGVSADTWTSVRCQL